MKRYLSILIVLILITGILLSIESPKAQTETLGTEGEDAKISQEKVNRLFQDLESEENFLNKFQQKNWMERTEIIKELVKSKKYNSAFKAKITIQALQTEIEKPTFNDDKAMGEGFGGGYTLSEIIQLCYIYSLQEIEKPQLIKSWLQKSDIDEKLKKRLVITLGLLKQKVILEELIGLLLNDKSDFIRALSATTLGELGDKRAIPALKKALKDPSWRIDKYADVIVPGMEKNYLVRIKAACALMKLGVKIKRTSFYEWKAIEK